MCFRTYTNLFLEDNCLFLNGCIIVLGSPTSFVLLLKTHFTTINLFQNCFNMWDFGSFCLVQVYIYCKILRCHKLINLLNKFLSSLYFICLSLKFSCCGLEYFWCSHFPSFAKQFIFLYRLWLCGLFKEETHVSTFHLDKHSSSTHTFTYIIISLSLMNVDLEM